MKSEKGITLISLILYLIILSIVLGILGIITNYFFNNMKYINNSGKDLYQLNKFNMYFVEDVKKNKEIYNIDEENEDKVTFEDGTIYTFSKNNIYRNKVKICENIKFFEVRKETKTDQNNFEKQILKVRIVMNDEDSTESQTDYVLKYW